MIKNIHTQSLVNNYYKNKQNCTTEDVYDSTMSKDAEYIANNVRRLMKYHGDNQMALSTKSGVAQKTISNIINQRAKGGPNFDAVSAIARAYKLETWHLIKGDLPDDLLSNKVLEKLIENFVNSDDTTRKAIMAVSEISAPNSEEQIKILKTR